MIFNSSHRPEPRASWPSWAPLALLVLVAGVLSGCAGMGGGGETSNYHVPAYAPTNPGNVHVYVSLRSKMVYVMEGDKPLLVTPTSIGVSGNATPTGNFAVTEKNATKRSGEYGFWVNGNDIYSGSSSQGRSGYHYVGYPMANWVAFTPGYGFHEGYVWPVPRSHGCLRIHKNVSVKFFKLVHIGTPVSIAQSQPYDSTLGAKAEHPSDYRDPDPASSFMVSPAYFSQPRDSELLTAPAKP